MDQLMECLDSYNINYEMSYSYIGHNKLTVKNGLFNIHIYDCADCGYRYMHVLSCIVYGHELSDDAFSWILQNLYGFGISKL